MSTTDQLLNVIVAAIPHPDQIKDIDTESESGAVRFTWRGTRFRVQDTIVYHTEEVKNDCKDLETPRRRALSWGEAIARGMAIKAVLDQAVLVPRLLKAGKRALRQFDQWDCEEESPRNAAAKSRNKSVRAYAALKAAIAAAKKEPKK